MASVNRVLIIGNLGKDPELKYMPSGDAVANFSVATTDTWKDKNGEKQERTEWHRCSAFAKLAEICGEYLKKGSQVYIEGKLQTRKWQDKDGQDKYTTEIVVERMQMLGGKQNHGHSDGSSQSQPERPAQSGGGAPHESQGQSSRKPSYAGHDDGGDIPFVHASFGYDPMLKDLNLLPTF